MQQYNIDCNSLAATPPATNTCQHPKHPHRLVHAEMNSSNASSQWNDRLPCVSGFVGGDFGGGFSCVFFVPWIIFWLPKGIPYLKMLEGTLHFEECPSPSVLWTSNTYPITFKFCLNLSCMHCSSISELLVQSTDLEVGNCQLPILHATQSTHELHATHGGWVGYSSPTTNRRFHGVLEDPRIFKNWMV